MNATWKNLGKYGMHLAGQVFHFFTKTFVGKILIKYGIALILLAYVLYKNWDGIVKVTERKIHFEPLIIATLIYIAGLLITFMRWHMLVRAVGLTFSRYEAVRLGLVGFFFNTFLPGAIGGDVVKAYAIARENSRLPVDVDLQIPDVPDKNGLPAPSALMEDKGKPGSKQLEHRIRTSQFEPLVEGETGPNKAANRERFSRAVLSVATVLIDRIIGLWALIWFVALVGSAFWILDDELVRNETLRAIIVSTIVFVAVSMAIWFALGFLSDERAARWADRLDGKSHFRHSVAGLWRACWMYRKRSRAVLIAMLVTLVAHGGWVLVFHYSVLAFPPPNLAEAGNLAEHAIIVPVGMTVSAFIPLPGGIGVGEFAYGNLYFELGKPYENGVVGCMSQRVLTFGLGLIGYIIYLRMRRDVPVEKAEETANTVIEPVPPLGDPVLGP